jgi:DNA-binding NarL/FixJ family response regulator
MMTRSKVYNQVDCRVVFVTGNRADRTLTRIPRLGDCRVLLKPLLTDELVGAIRQVWGLTSATHDQRS